MDRDKLVKDLIRDEGLKLKPYHCTADKLTIGIGRNLEDLGITESEAIYLAINDIIRSEAELDQAFPWWRGMPEPAQRALVNMLFNLGLTRLVGFRNMLGALQMGDYQAAAAEALDSRWARQVGARAQRIAALFGEAGK